MSAANTSSLTASAEPAAASNSSAETVNVERTLKEASAAAVAAAAANAESGKPNRLRLPDAQPSRVGPYPMSYIPTGANRIEPPGVNSTNFARANDDATKGLRYRSSPGSYVPLGAEESDRQEGALNSQSTYVAKKYAAEDAAKEEEKKKTQKEADEKAEFAEKIHFTKQPIVTVATCNLNQWALDFTGNQRRIIESIKLAKAAGCTYRLGPELEITGYSCEDHFYELDTIMFGWMSLSDIIMTKYPDTEENRNKKLVGTYILQDILCDFGMPVLHNGVRYNCRVFVLNGKILLIRPKMWMADDGNYREDRHFTPWAKSKMEVLEDYSLPEEIRSTLGGQTTAPFGVGIIDCIDGSIGSEVCEELFTAESINIYLGFEGVDIMSNGSASHFQMGKRSRRHELVKEATKKNGGIYLYSNMLGCDGNRMVFDGNGMIYMNGELKAVGEHLSFHEVEVVTATLNLNDVRTFRASSVSHQMQSDQRSVKMPRVKVDFHLAGPQLDTGIYDVTPSIEATLLKIKEEKEEDEEPIKKPRHELPKDTEARLAAQQYAYAKNMPMEEEMGLSVSRYLWDYLCRSGAGAFMLPLSGGVDSGSTSLMVYFMCDKIVSLMNAEGTTIPIGSRTETHSENQARLREFIIGRIKPTILKNFPNYNKDPRVMTPQNLMEVVLHTVNLPTDNNSGEIKWFAYNLAKALGSYHMTVPINNAFVELRQMVQNIQFGYEPEPEKKNASEMMNVPRYKSSGGDWQENLAIQNIQARLRMITPYYLAQIIPMHRYNQQILGGSSKYDSHSDLPYDDDYGNMTWNIFHEEVAKLETAWKATNPDFKTNKAKKFHIGDEIKKSSLSNKKSLEAFYNKYIFARPGSPFLLVLASSNSDEALRGFYTKYDASSADLNPIGSFSKKHLRKYLKWCVGRFSNASQDFSVLNEILSVAASPELTPADLTSGNVQVQKDETEIEMTYEDLYEFGIMRKRYNMGPLAMFLHMCRQKLGGTMYVLVTKPIKNLVVQKATPTQIAIKLEIFLKFYNTHRNKMTILTPSIHATDYSPDDNRFDQRPFLLPHFSTLYQMKVIHALAAKMEGQEDIKQLIAIGQTQVKAEEDYEKAVDDAERVSFKQKYAKRQLNFMTSHSDRKNLTEKFASHPEYESARLLSASKTPSQSSSSYAFARRGGRRVTRNKAREQRRRTAKFGNLN